MSENACDALREFPEFITESRGEICIKVHGKYRSLNINYRKNLYDTVPTSRKLLKRRLAHPLLLSQKTPIFDFYAFLFSNLESVRDGRTDRQTYRMTKSLRYSAKGRQVGLLA